LIATTW